MDRNVINAHKGVPVPHVSASEGIIQCIVNTNTWHYFLDRRSRQKASIENNITRDYSLIH